MDLWPQNLKEQLKEVDELLEMARIKGFNMENMEITFVDGHPALTTKTDESNFSS